MQSLKLFKMKEFPAKGLGKLGWEGFEKTVLN
jgi:hypothetical protein